MPTVSVVIPIYNSERYLEECILSVLNQSYKNIELILVDDGSSDNSGSICNRFCDRKNVRYIRQINRGVSFARQSGVNAATGEWILFVDSDDTIPFDSIQKMVSISAGVDIVAGATNRDHRHKLLPDYISSGEYTDLLFSENFGPSPVCKLFRHSLFSDNTIKQFGNYASGEDLLMNLSLAVSNKKRVRVCKEPIYYYRSNECSTTHRFQYTFDYCLSYFQSKESIVKEHLSNEAITILGLRQKIRFFYHVVVSSGFHNNNAHPFVKELFTDLSKYQRYNVFDRFALICTNRTLLKLTYYFYRLRVRITRRLYF